MQQFANTHSMRNEILSLMSQHGLEDDCYVEMLDYTIDLFESQGLGTEYYGYHNINHELEVTYVSQHNGIIRTDLQGMPLYFKHHRANIYVGNMLGREFVMKL